MAIEKSPSERLLNHLHPHPLQFLDYYNPAVDGCRGCGKLFKGEVSNIYHCGTCKFFSMHKRCADLPREICHPKHSQHPLTLHGKPPYPSSACLCNVCGKRWKFFTYHCSLCVFNICRSCAFMPTIEHPSHMHSLTLLQRPSLFHCDACGMKAEEESYVCIPCDLWIHVTCALSLRVLALGDHEHLLTLAYSVPRRFSDFKSICIFCDMDVNPPNWFYSCAQCRYFVHLRCTKSNTRNNGSKITAKEEDVGTSLDLIHLPIDKSVDMISHFVAKMGLGDSKTTPTTITNFSHHHPLQLFEEESKETENNKKWLCEGCVQPTSAPFYSCDQCNFSLHKCCAELPQNVQHQCHPDHTLFLSSFCDDVSWCFVCKNPCNGFHLKCKENGCQFSLDLRCASLPSQIAHEAHRHPLLLRAKEKKPPLCNACGKDIIGLVLVCEICGFYLDTRCALMPRTTWHRWEKHPLFLSYPPFIYHPGEFYCEYCEKEMNPKYWLYQCRDCDRSFHPDCLTLVDRFSNVKHGATVTTLLCHPHSLTCDRHNENESKCDMCLEDCNACLSFRCLPCNFHICYNCLDLVFNFKDHVLPPQHGIVGISELLERLQLVGEFLSD